MSNITSVTTTFFWLVFRDLRGIAKNFLTYFLDGALLPLSVVFTSGYIMPAMGLADDYGAFILVSTALGMCYNCCGMDSLGLITDLEGAKSIFYELALPMPYWLVYLKIGTAYALKSILTNVLVFPIGALILGSKLSLANLALGKAVLMYLLSNILYSAFALTSTIFMENSDSHGRFWIRWGWQIFTLAGWGFSWNYFYKAAPTVALFNLANPIMYTMEGLRAAMLGQEGYLDYWLCCGAILFFTLIIGFVGLWKFKKRLDCV